MYLQDQELNEAGFSKKKLFFKAMTMKWAFKGLELKVDLKVKAPCYSGSGGKGTRGQL